MYLGTHGVLLGLVLHELLEALGHEGKRVRSVGGGDMVGGIEASRVLAFGVGRGVEGDGAHLTPSVSGIVEVADNVDVGSQCAVNFLGTVGAVEGVVLAAFLNLFVLCDKDKVKA